MKDFEIEQDINADILNYIIEHKLKLTEENQLRVFLLLISEEAEPTLDLTFQYWEEEEI